MSATRELTGALGAFRAFSFAGPRPNPASGGTRFRFDLTRTGAVRLAVYDTSGRLVRVLADGVLGAGEQVVAWDQRDARGALVRGVFFARLTAGGEAGARTVVAL